MKIFNYVALIATATMAVTSCSNDELTNAETANDQTAINFSTYLGRAPQSRAGVTETGANMGVYAFLTTSKYDSETSMAPNFMCNQEVKSAAKEDNSGYTWSYTPVKYWPNNTTDMISFFAYAPYNASGITMSSKEVGGTPTATVTLQDADNMIDFVAGNAMNKTYSNSTSGNVNFTLKHEMTRVAFKATTTVEAGTVVTIKKVTLSGAKLYSTGKYTFSTSDNSEHGSWEVSDNSSFTLSVPVNEEGIVLSKDANTKDIYSYLFLIPVDKLEEGGVKATIEYDITTTDGSLKDGSITTSATKVVNLTAETLAKGSAYVYTFNIGLNAVTLSATVAGWDNVTAEKTNADIKDVTVPAQGSDSQNNSTGTTKD